MNPNMNQMNPNMVNMRGMHPNANPNQPGGLSQLQQRLTQQRMSRMQGPGGMPMVQNSMYTINTTGVGPNIQVSSPAMIMTTGASPISGGHFVSSPQQPPHMAGVPSPSQRMSAPSPSQTSIRTPQNNADMQQQQQQQQTPGEQAYLDKVRQLQKYIEPLRKMIAKIGNEDQEKLKKMTKLMDILSNPTKRLPYNVLLRCEDVLEHMIRDAPSDSGNILHESSSSMNPLLESVIKLKNHKMATPSTSLSLNHTLCRTFNSSLDAIGGPEMTLPPVKRRKRCSDVTTTAGEYDVLPDHVQGEVAQLHSRFKVVLEPAQPNLLPNGSIDLVCHLEDNDLPAVPPITVTLQPNYPSESSPQLHDQYCSTEYDTSPFLKRVREALRSRMRKVPNRFTLTQLLTAWEMSVRSACSFKEGKFDIPLVPPSVSAV